MVSKNVIKQFAQNPSQGMRLKKTLYSNFTNIEIKHVAIIAK